MKIFWSCIATTLGLMMISCSSVVQQMEFIPVPGEEEPAKAETTENEDKNQPAAVKTQKKEGQDSTATTKSDSDASDFVPTPEQQEAAAKLLTDNKPGEATATTHDILPEPVAQEEVLVDAVPNTSGIPGRNSLRMHRYAPPEEAASASEAKALTPNRAERHGFRSPVLPTKLPMDINGKLTGEGNN